jgi:dipeptide/tripeptide permease
MDLMHFHGFVLIATILFYFLLRKYMSTSDNSTKNRLYITLYVPIISYIMYYIFSSHTSSKLNEFGENVVVNNIDESFMSDLFQSSVAV